jgi:hypothetical protein
MKSKEIEDDCCKMKGKLRKMKEEQITNIFFMCENSHNPYSKCIECDGYDYNCSEYEPSRIRDIYSF